MTRWLDRTIMSAPHAGKTVSRFPSNFWHDNQLTLLETNMHLSGGCLCGSVRYECSTEPVIAGNCHCRDCQKSSGSGFAPTFFVPENSIAIKGSVKYFTSKGGSGSDVNRGFCPNCGSQLFGKPAAMPGLIGVRAGTLDNPSSFRPKVDIFTSHAAPWDVLDPNSTKFAKAPPPV